MLLGWGIWEVDEIVLEVSFELLSEGTSMEVPMKNIIELPWMSSSLMSAHLKSWSLVNIVKMPGRSTERAKCNPVKNCINSDLKWHLFQRDSVDLTSKIKDKMGIMDSIQ